VDGTNGTNGVDGQDGASAYETWLALGNTGSEADFIASLTGPQGATGATGATGPQGLQGPAGVDGTNGTNGVDGQDGASAYETWLALGNTGTEADFIASLTGPQGATGADGQGGVTNAGTNVTITGTGTVGDPYVVNATDNVDDADNDPNNELQALWLSNDTLYLSNGNGVYIGGMNGSTSGTNTAAVNGNSVTQYFPSYLFDTGDCSAGNFSTSGNYILTNTFAQYCNLKINAGDVFNLGTNNSSDGAKTYTILVSDTLFLDGTINGNNLGFSNYGPIGCATVVNNTAGGAGGAAPNNSANYIMAGINNTISWTSYGNSLNINPPQYSATISGGSGTSGSCLTAAQRNGKSSTAAILSEAIKIRSDLYGSPGTANRTWNSSACSYQNNGGDGGDGLYLICRVVVISGSGLINLNGNNGAQYVLAGYPTVYGGGGGGGSLILCADEIILNSGTISNSGGVGGNSGSVSFCNSGNGGNGSTLIIEY
jgi:hypothetical protein